MSNMKSEEDVSQKVIEREDDLSNLISKGIADGDVKKLKEASLDTCEDLLHTKKRHVRMLTGLSEARVDKILEAGKELAKSTTADSEKKEKKKRKVTEDISEVKKKNKKFKWAYVTTLNEVHKALEGGHLDMVFMLEEQKESPKIKEFCEILGISLEAVHGEVKEITSVDQFMVEYLSRGRGYGPEKYHYLLRKNQDAAIFSLLRGHKLNYTEI